MESWNAISVTECGEPLVPLRNTGNLLAHPEYYRQGVPGALENVYVRESVAQRLEQAANALPRHLDLTLLVLDGWRSLELQTHLYEQYREFLSNLYPVIGEELESLTRTFVATPSADPLIPFPHHTGGAVDVTLGDEWGRPLEMGAEFDELSERTHADYYERHGFNPRTQRVKARRRWLRQVMEEAGFVNYEEEFFHFDYGNQRWAIEHQGSAIYGATLPVLTPAFV